MKVGFLLMRKVCVWILHVSIMSVQMHRCFFLQAGDVDGSVRKCEADHRIDFSFCIKQGKK